MKLTPQERETIRAPWIKSVSISTKTNEDGTIYSFGLHEDCADVDVIADHWLDIIDEQVEKAVAKRDALWKERDKKMFFYYKSVFKDGFEDGYPAEWDEFFNDK